MADVDSPYQPPVPARPAAGAAINPRPVPAGHAVDWLSEGWALFRRSPLVWIAVSVIALLAFLALGIIPVLGPLATTLLSVLFAGGLMLGCRAQDQGGELSVAHLFAGFQQHLSPLLVVGALYLAALFVLFLLLFLIAGGATFAVLWGQADAGASLGAGLLAMLVALLVIVPLTMVVWFAPALVTLHEIAPQEAMKLSFQGCLRNIGPFLVYGVLLLVLAILASIPLGLGWLVLMPVMVASVYAGYKDIFLPG